MLNELRGVATSLKRAGIQPKDWDDEYSPLKKTKLAFFVFVDSVGTISRVESVGDPKGTEGLRKWESKGDLRQSFPYFNVPPLLLVPSKKDADAFEKNVKTGRVGSDEIRDFLKRLDARGDVERWDSGSEWGSNALRKLDACLNKGRELGKVLGGGHLDEDCRAILHLVDRLPSSGAQFYDGLLSAFRGLLPDSVDLRDGLLAYGEPAGNSVTLLLELADSSQCPYPVRHEKIRDWVNERLRARCSQGSVAIRPGGADIFGDDSRGWKEKFESVTMPSLGIVKLRSMASAAPCQARYGTDEGESCQVGAESRRRMKGALEWLTHRAREGKTWRPLSAGSGQEILLAYPTVLPPEPPNLATFFGGGTDGAGKGAAAARFEDCAASVTACLTGLAKEHPLLDVRVFVLRKMDKARTRVSSSLSVDAARLAEAAREWREGCRNVPGIRIRRLSVAGKPQWEDPVEPFPMEVVWLGNTAWSLHNGTSSRVQGLVPQDGIRLLVERGLPATALAARILGVIDRNCVGLALCVGDAHARGRAFVGDPKKNSRTAIRQSAILPTTLGLLLAKTGHRKEAYMKSAPYLVGRLLSLADGLHFHYCEHVRKKQVPPQLVGNALMPTALEEPAKALALCGNRLLPYQAWARTVSGEAARLARFFLAELGKVCEDLKYIDPAAMPRPCSDADKAQMLIGYLARPEKKETAGTRSKGGADEE